MPFLELLQALDKTGSSEWYAVHILELHATVRRALAQNDAREVPRRPMMRAPKPAHIAVAAAMELMYVIMTSEFKVYWQPYAVAGEKSHRGASQSGQDRAAKYRWRDEQIHEKAREFWQGKSKKSISAAEDYVRKHWLFDSPLPHHSRLRHIIAAAKAQ